MNERLRLDAKSFAILVAIVLFAVAAAALVTYRVVDYRILVDAGVVAGERRPDRSTPDLGPTHDLGVMTMDLAASPAGIVHSLRAQLGVAVPDEHAVALPEQRKVQGRDRIVASGRGRTMEDLEGEAGLMQLRSGLVTALSDIRPGQAVRNLYFVDLVRQ